MMRRRRRGEARPGPRSTRDPPAAISSTRAHRGGGRVDVGAGRHHDGRRARTPAGSCHWSKLSKLIGTHDQKQLALVLAGPQCVDRVARVIRRRAPCTSTSGSPANAASASRPRTSADSCLRPPDAADRRRPRPPGGRARAGRSRPLQPPRARCGAGRTARRRRRSGSLAVAGADTPADGSRSGCRRRAWLPLRAAPHRSRAARTRPPAARPSPRPRSRASAARRSISPPAIRNSPWSRRIR